MPKSNSRLPFGRGSGTVTVIEQPVMRSYLRKAKIVFFIIWAATALLIATVAASTWEPKFGPTGAAVIGLIVGGLAGLVPAFLLAAVVAAWPVLRAIWWWLPELAATSGLAIGWVELSAHTTPVICAVITAVIAGVVIIIRPVRRGVSAVVWCLVSRHRIRTCFSEFIITNRTGSLPLILGARPTPAGERLWIWLRPGLCLADVQGHTDEIAAACWATAIVADQANTSNAALVRLDIKRRDPQTGTVSSPLTELLAGALPGRKQDTAPVAEALDLPDVPPAEVTKPAHKSGPAPWPQSQPTLEGVIVNPDAAKDDINDWI